MRTADGEDITEMEKAAPRVATKPMRQFTGRKKKKEQKKKQKFVYDTHSRPGQGRSENKVENVMRAEEIRKR